MGASNSGRLVFHQPTELLSFIESFFLSNRGLRASFCLTPFSPHYLRSCQKAEMFLCKQVKWVNMSTVIAFIMLCLFSLCCVTQHVIGCLRMSVSQSGFVRRSLHLSIHLLWYELCFESGLFSSTSIRLNNILYTRKIIIKWTDHSLYWEMRIPILNAPQPFLQRHLLDKLYNYSYSSVKLYIPFSPSRSACLHSYSSSPFAVHHHHHLAADDYYLATVLDLASSREDS